MTFLASRQRFFIVLTCSWVFLPKNDTERLWYHLQNQVLESKRAVMVKNLPHLLNTTAKKMQQAFISQTPVWIHTGHNMGPYWTHLRAHEEGETILDFFLKFRSGRCGRFCQKIVEIGTILAILLPLEAEFVAETLFLGEFGRSSLDLPHNPPQSGFIPGRSA